MIEIRKELIESGVQIENNNQNLFSLNEIDKQIIRFWTFKIYWIYEQS